MQPLNVAVYRQYLGVPSEPFISTQAASIPDARVSLIGLEQVGPVVEESLQIFVMQDGRRWTGHLQSQVMKLTRYAPTLRRRLVQTNSQVVLAHFLADGWRIAPTARRARANLAVVVHGSIIDKSGSGSAGDAKPEGCGTQLKRLVEEVDLFLPVSHFLRERLVAKGVPAEKAVAHYIGVDCDVPQRTGPPSRPHFLYVGRLVPNKGAQYAVEAIADIPDAQLTVVGSGPDADALRVLARRLGVVERVRFMGALSKPCIQAEMAGVHRTGSPQRGTADRHFRGPGTSAARGASSGGPAIVFDTGGLSETVLDSKTGFIVPAKDVRQLRARMIELVDDRSRT